jgi:hypothetical protein
VADLQAKITAMYDAEFGDRVWIHGI